MTRVLAIGLVVAVSASAAGAAPRQAPAATPAVPAAPAAPVEAAGPAATDPAATTPPGAVPGDVLAPLPPQGHTYTAEGRRDPFVTLVKRGADATATTAAARAAGLAGLNTGEVSLRGTLASRGGYVAMLLGSDDKTYIVHEGDALADGTIRTITSETLVILQQVNDPLAQRKPREVRKMLRRLDGTN